MKQVQCSLFYELASTASKNGDWQKTIKNLEYFLKETSAPERSCITCFELGMAYGIVDEFTNAAKYFNLCVQRHRKDSTFEFYAVRKSKEYLQKGILSKFDKMIYECRQRMTANGHSKILMLLKDSFSETDLTTPDERAVYQYLLGASYHKTKESEKAFKHLVAAYKEKAPVETWTQPFSLVDCAELEISLKNSDQAKKALETAKSFKDYNFQSELSQRMSRLSDRLNGVEYKIV